MQFYFKIGRYIFYFHELDNVNNFIHLFKVLMWNSCGNKNNANFCIMNLFYKAKYEIKESLFDVLLLKKHSSIEINKFSWAK